MKSILAALPFALVGCTSSAGGGDCATLGMINEGTMTAATPAGAFEAECIHVQPVGNRLSVTAVASTSVLQGVQPETISFTLWSDTTGTYYSVPPPGTFVTPDGVGTPLTASYRPGDESDVAPMPVAGDLSVVVLEEGGAEALRGRFELQDADPATGRPVGAAVTGTFDVKR